MVAGAVSGSSLVGVGLSLLNGYGAYRFDLHSEARSTAVSEGPAT
jgi:hypothetical protein